MIAKILTFFRKPKQPEVSMTKLMELVALVKKLIDELGASRATVAARDSEIASLKDELLAAQVQAEKDDAMIAELMSVIDGAIGSGGSMGGISE